MERYNPFEHTLIEFESDISPGDVRRNMNAVVPAEVATLLLFAAEPGKTSAKYESANSLVWRDAGVLLGYLSIASESLGLNFAPLGVTGDPFTSELIKQPGLVGVGAAWVGSGK